MADLKKRVPFHVTAHAHTCAWRHSGDAKPDKTKPQYCVYDDAHEDYVYTRAWLELLVRDLSDAAKYEQITGRPPTQR